MLGFILVSPFGSPWRVRELCCSRNPLIRKAAKVLYSLYQYDNGSSVAWNAEFAGKPVFPHGMKSIFVSGDAKVGKNCVIFQQVTIGSVALPDSSGRGAPIIRNNVYIGAGAKIIGNVRVGDNVRIGANAVVHRDVPDNAVVVIGEQRVILKENTQDNRFYTYRKGWGYIDEGRFETVHDPDLIAALSARPMTER